MYNFLFSCPTDATYQISYCVHIYSLWQLCFVAFLSQLVVMSWNLSSLRDLKVGMTTHCRFFTSVRGSHPRMRGWGGFYGPPPPLPAPPAAPPAPGLAAEGGSSTKLRGWDFRGGRGEGPPPPGKEWLVVNVFNIKVHMKRSSVQIQIQTGIN